MHHEQQEQSQPQKLYTKIEEQASSSSTHRPKMFHEHQDILNANLKGRHQAPKINRPYYYDEALEPPALHDSQNPLYGEIEEIIDPIEKRFNQIKNFDVLQYPPLDHYFFQRRSPNVMFLSEKFDSHVKVKKEWEEELKPLLPNSIHVRGYLLRPDLMRAMIIGQQGTLFNLGLFFFDIRFPTNYPHDPPELFYHSYGLEVSPYLYKDGKVCFINTPNATSKSKWYNNWNISNNRGNSSKPKEWAILETLKSIQSAILTRKPDCDDKAIFIQMCKGMLCMLKSPPRNFEDFVKGYFRTRAHQILMNCRVYRMDSDEGTKRLFFKLVRAFEANGTYCNHHYESVQYALALKQEEKEEPQKKEAEEKYIAISCFAPRGVSSLWLQQTYNPKLF